MTGFTAPVPPIDGGQTATVLVVEGGTRLNGIVDVKGNKNAALPLLAACLLTDELCQLTNVPQIRDVGVMVELLRGLGAEVDGIGTTSLQIQCRNITGNEPDPRLVGRLRGSVLLVGPLLARTGSVRLAPPGGDFPARRTINSHLQALGAMGVVGSSGEFHEFLAPDGLKPASVYLEEASVTGTETALLAASAALGRTEIRHAACEPHVKELCEFLRTMGVEIRGDGTPTIEVVGGMKLAGGSRQLRGDYIEAGSWAVAAAVTGGEIEVRGVEASDLEPIVAILDRMNVMCSIGEGSLRVSASEVVNIRQITTAPWPGFPSDMVSLVSVLATQAKGRTLIHDWMYELRLFALEQLSGMGADLFLCDPHRMIVNGPTKLKGRNLDTRDLRSGMALISAALAADGISRVGPIETVERGYEDLVKRLKSLGAIIELEPAQE